MGIESFFSSNADSCILRQLSDEIQQTQQRCDLILECKRQIQYWKSKLEVLEDEQATFIKLARLRMDAVTTWKSLSRKERTEKRFILAALSESPSLPATLEEFPSSSFPPHIRLDRDILLARVRRDDFGKHLAKYHHRETIKKKKESQNDDNNDEEEEGSGGGNSGDVMDRYFFVPPRLRSDKQVILAILPKYPHVIEYMSSSLRDDPHVLKELLKHHPGPTLPKNFIQHFSDRIRSSAKVLLDIVLRQHHPYVASALAFCGQDLRNDKNFILKAIEIGAQAQIQLPNAHHWNGESETQILKYASHRLRADREVVELAVQHSGLNLKHASYQLRRDKELVIKASYQNGRAFRYCLPGTVKEELFRDRDFLMHVVQSIPNYVFKNCDPLCCFRDRELVVKAAIHGLNWDLIPMTFQLEENFLCQVIREAPHRYLELPEETRELLAVASAVFQAERPADDELLEATECRPDLLANRDAMWVIANLADTEIIPETLKYSPEHIRCDKELMLRAIRNDSAAFEYCTEDLQEDMDVILAAVPASLYMLPGHVQVENIEIVRRAISNMEKRNIWMIHDDICKDVWNNRDIAKTWLENGGIWLEDDFPDDFESDEELVLIAIRQKWSEFEFASADLKNDKEFMLRALAVDARVIRDVGDDLRYDYDLALAAFGNDQSPAAIQFYSGAEDFEFMVGFAKWVREQIDQHTVFQTEIFANIIKSKRSSHDPCHLGLLNQGPELVGFYAKSLSDFLGLPDQHRIKLLETVSRNFLSWGL